MSVEMRKKYKLTSFPRLTIEINSPTHTYKYKLASANVFLLFLKYFLFCSAGNGSLCMLGNCFISKSQVFSRYFLYVK